MTSVSLLGRSSLGKGDGESRECKNSAVLEPSCEELKLKGTLDQISVVRSQMAFSRWFGKSLPDLK